jgi:4-amino-4-deoxy-L-arabinose transferase-like glycosyltransferase
MLSRIPTIYITSGIWVVLMGVALWLRPHLPVDETRYLGVAWEMWLRSDFLVPYLNGEPYSHKPPLLFWLMHAGWSVLGVNEWWPRLVAPLFGLGCLFLIRSLSQALWPGDKKTQDLSLLFLTGCLFWTLFVTITMFDMILAFFAVLGLLGIIKSYIQRQRMGFFLIAIAIGLGILSKGPAIFLYILPVAFSAPLWSRRMARVDPNACYKALRWYGLLFASIAVGIVLALVWAIPAGISGGDVYQHDIFWGQVTGRMVKSFAHQRAFWWYAVLFPLLILPWCIWPPLWKSMLVNGRSLWRDGCQLFCLIWFATAFIAFSAISGKQLHYLLPGFPAVALLFARSLSLNYSNQKPTRRQNTLPALVFVALAIILILLPMSILPIQLPIWSTDVNSYAGILILIVAFWGLFFVPSTFVGSSIQLTLLPVGLVISLQIAMAPVLWSRYDLRPISKQLKVFENAGISLAIYGKNHGQFQFLGRLTKPLTTVGQRSGQLEDFLKDHPAGRIIAYYENVPTRAKPIAVYPMRQKFMVIWDSKTMIENPGIGIRQ